MGVRSISMEDGTDVVQIPSLKWNELTQVEDRTHLFTHRGWDVNIKGVRSDLPFDLEKSHRFRCQRPNAAKLFPMVITLVDQDVLADFELVVRLLAIAHLFGPRPFMVQRAEHQGRFSR